MRTQQEILSRVEELKNLFNTQTYILLSFVGFELAKPYLLEDFVKKVEEGDEQWAVLTDPKKAILHYLNFAYREVEDKRGLSAARRLHLKTCIWLDDEKFYNEVIDLIDDRRYELLALNTIAEHYGYVRS